MKNYDVSYFAKDPETVARAILGGRIQFSMPKINHGNVATTRSGKVIIEDILDFFPLEVYAVHYSFTRPPTHSKLPPGITAVTTNLGGRTIPTLVIGTGCRKEDYWGARDPHAHVTIVGGWSDYQGKGEDLNRQFDIALKLGLFVHPELHEFYSGRNVSHRPIKVELGDIAQDLEVRKRNLLPFPPTYEREGYVLTLAQKKKSLRAE